MTWMRDWKASSKVPTRLVVRKRMPLKYSRVRRKTGGLGGLG